MLIGEGVGTVLSGRQATGNLAIAALSASNLPAVAKAMRERYPAAALVILADLVKATGELNPHAIEAARAVAGLVAVSDFGEDRPEGATDFNDLALHRGREAVRRAIASAKAPAEQWPELQSLDREAQSEPYPLDALPEIIQAAVVEVQGFTKAPVPLVASATLGAVSIATQAHVDVKRAERLSGPS